MTENKQPEEGKSLTPDQMLKKHDVEIDRWPDTQMLIHKAMADFADQEVFKAQREMTDKVNEARAGWRDCDKQLQSLQAYNGKLVEAAQNLINKCGRDIRFLNYEAWNQMTEALSSFTDKTKEV